MSRIKFLSAAVGALAFACSSSVMAQACSIAAWSNAATTTAVAQLPPGNGRYSGSCAAVVASAGANSFVVDNSPTNEPSYRARAYAYTSDLGGAEADIFQAQNATGTNIIRVTYTAGTGFRFYVNGANGGASLGTVPAVANRWYGFEVRWANNGTFTAIVRGNQAAAPAQPQISVTGFSNAADRIETARLGILTTTGVTGGARFDDFDSRRTTDIGFLVRGDANASGGVNIGDAIAIRNEVNGGALGAGNADCNEDGQVNTGDQICVRNIVNAG